MFTADSGVVWAVQCFALLKFIIPLFSEFLSHSGRRFNMSEIMFKVSLFLRSINQINIWRFMNLFLRFSLARDKKLYLLSETIWPSASRTGTYGISHERDQGITSHHSLTLCQIYYFFHRCYIVINLAIFFFSVSEELHHRTYKNQSLSVGIEVEVVAVTRSGDVVSGTGRFLDYMELS